MGRNRFDNRLLSLWDTKGLNENSIPLPLTSNPNILSYGGGPGSSLGIGSTNIKFATLNDGITPARTGVNRKTPYREVGYKNYGLSNKEGGILYNPINIYGEGASIKYLKSSYNGIFSNKEYTDADLWGPGWFDLWKVIGNVFEHNLQPWIRTSMERKNSDDETISLVPSQTKIDDRLTRKEENKERYGKFNIRNTGDAGTSKSEKSNKPVNPITGQKRLNHKSYNENNVKTKRDEKELTDFVEFTIAVQPGDKVGRNRSKSYLTFPAFIEGISDSFSSDYKTINYMGRPEPFYKYSGFKRDISFSFTVVAQSKAEIGVMYEKLNFLASTVAPSYTSEGYMTGNIAYLTIGDIYIDQPGIIGGFSFNVPEEATWDIGLEEIGSTTVGNGAQAPMMIKVDGFKFTPLYNQIPQFGSSIWFGSDKLIDTKELLSTSEAFDEVVLDYDDKIRLDKYLVNPFVDPNTGWGSKQFNLNL